MHDEDGANFELVLEVGDWEQKSHGALVKFKPTAPAYLRLPSEILGNLEPGRSGFSHYDGEARVSINGRLDAGIGPKGTLTIRRDTIGAQYPNDRDYFAGLCKVDLSTEFKRLPA